MSSTKLILPFVMAMLPMVGGCPNRDFFFGLQHEDRDFLTEDTRTPAPPSAARGASRAT